MGTHLYYFHIVNDHTIRDPAGSKHTSDTAARIAGVERLQRLRRAKDSRKLKIVVTNAEGRPIFEIT